MQNHLLYKDSDTLKWVLTNGFFSVATHMTGTTYMTGRLLAAF